MSRAEEGLRKLLQILPDIADGKDYELEVVAQRAGMSVKELTRRLRAMVDRLDEPGGFMSTVQIYLEPNRVSVFTQHFHRPMRLTRSELGALELGLAMLRATGAREDSSVVDSALERLRKIITSLPDDERQTGIRTAELASGGDARHFATIRDSLRARKAVVLCYRSSDAAESRERTVRPYCMAYSNGQWYLTGYCELATEVRHFRLDRVEGAEATEQGYRIPASFNMDEYMSEHGVFSASDSPPMKVRYSARIARWIAEREKQEPDADGTLTLEHPVANQEWAVRHVLQYGPDAEVLEPESLRNLVAERVRLLGKALAG